MDSEIIISRDDLSNLLEVAISLEDVGDVIKATSLYRIGANQGDISCMTRLADVLSEPPEFIDIKLAERLYKQACVAGHADACRNLAILYNQLGKSDLYSRYMELAKARGDSWQEDE